MAGLYWSNVIDVEEWDQNYERQNNLEKKFLSNNANINVALEYMKSDPNASVHKTSAMFNVPRSTLRDRLSGWVSIDAKPGRRTKLGQVLEEKLIDYTALSCFVYIVYSIIQHHQRKCQNVKYHGKTGYLPMSLYGAKDNTHKLVAVDTRRKLSGGRGM